MSNASFLITHDDFGKSYSLACMNQKQAMTWLKKKTVIVSFIKVLYWDPKFAKNAKKLFLLSFICVNLSRRNSFSSLKILSSLYSRLILIILNSFTLFWSLDWAIFSNSWKGNEATRSRKKKPFMYLMAITLCLTSNNPCFNSSAVMNVSTMSVMNDASTKRSSHKLLSSTKLSLYGTTAAV